MGHGKFQNMAKAELIYTRSVYVDVFECKKCSGKTYVESSCVPHFCMSCGVMFDRANMNPYN